MSVPYYGDFAEDDTVNIPFNTFSSNDPSASVTVTDLVDADIFVHKDGSATAITTDGASIDIDAPGVGAHMVTIDTSVDAAYGSGEYSVRINGVTVDGGTINAWIGSFSIERVGGALALIKLIQAAVITNAAGVDVAADIIALKAETVLIVADTGELQSDDTPTAIAGLDTKLDTIAAYLDTEIAAILEDTGTTIPATLSTMDGKLDAIDNLIDTEIAAIINTLKGTVISEGTLGATGNDTTHLHLTGLTYGDGELTGYFIVVFDNSTSEYHAIAITDWILSTELATVGLLPFTPEASVDTYHLLSTQAGSSSAPTAGDVADAVWDETQVAHVGVGTMGELATEIASILADTGELQSDDTPGALAALDGKIDIIDANVDAVLTDTGTLGTPAGASHAADIAAIKADTAAILTDTATTLSDKIDVIDGIVDNILTDTGTTIPATLATIKGIIDAILVDTGTTLNDKIDVIDGIADTILLDTGELQADNVPGLIASLNNISAAAVLSEVNDALNTNIAELGVAAPSDTPTLRTGLMLLYMALVNKTSVQTSGTDALEVNNAAGTIIAKKLITDDGADLIEAKMTSG